MLPHPNLIILFLAQAIFASGSVVLVTVGGIVGSHIAPVPGLATLPVSLMVAGTAITAVPASLFMGRFGRRAGFGTASMIAIVSSLLAATAVHQAAFVSFCIAAVGIGATMAFGQQMRFAAAECVPEGRAGQAVSFILLGAIGGALIGAELVSRAETVDPDDPFRFAFLGLAGAHVAAIGLLSFLRTVRPATDAAGSGDAPRGVGAFVRDPAFVLAVAAAVVGQGTMTFLMTATPVAMHVMDGHGMAETAGVVRAHVIAMYAPSLASAFLIARFGTRGLMTIGTLLLLGCVLAGFAGHEVMHYTVTLVLLGIGWNFLFIGGTTALVATYRPQERFRAQAINEFCVFGAAAVASTLAGATVLSFGWERVLMGVVPVLLVMLAALTAGRIRRPVRVS
jgi:MFS family permease